MICQPARQFPRRVVAANRVSRDLTTERQVGSALALLQRQVDRLRASTLNELNQNHHDRDH